MLAPPSWGVVEGLGEEDPPSRASLASRLSRIWSRSVAGLWLISGSAENHTASASDSGVEDISLS